MRMVDIQDYDALLVKHSSRRANDGELWHSAYGYGVVGFNRRLIYERHGTQNT